MIDAYCSLPHYWQHVEPVWLALPDAMRGQVWAPRQGCPWGRSLTTRPRRDPWGPVIVASFADARRMAGRRLVLVEHGSGQAYQGVDNGSYSGGLGLNDVVLFIVPNEQVAERWRFAYQDTPVAVVGCPKLDRFHRVMLDGATENAVMDGGTLEQPGCARQPRKLKVGSSNLPGAPHPIQKGGRDGSRAVPTPRGGPVVAVTAHWECRLVPETMPALPYYRQVLPVLRDEVRSWGGQLIGHWHPRAEPQMRRLWASLGVEAVESSDDVLDRADLLIADNTSLLYEFASLGKPVDVLNAPWYRRDVEHQLRFWSMIPGVTCDEPEDLIDSVSRALADPPEVRGHRQRVVSQVYAYTDGRAAERAADAVRTYASPGT